MDQISESVKDYYRKECSLKSTSDQYDRLGHQITREKREVELAKERLKKIGAKGNFLVAPGVMVSINNGEISFDKLTDISKV